MKSPHTKALKKTIRNISEVSEFLWQRGWAERNAGNISVNITDIMQHEEVDISNVVELETPYAELAGCCFLISGTGKRMRDLAKKPSKNVLIIKLNEYGTAFWIQPLKDSVDIFMPTSEMPTHLKIHQMIAIRGSSEKVVLHTHANELIALTQAKEYRDEQALNTLLWGMHPESMVFIPKGIGLVPYILPGSVEIAMETVNVLQDHDIALWAKHGVFAIGESVHDTFDKIDILAKAARIFFMCRQANITPEILTSEELAELKLQAAKF